MHEETAGKFGYSCFLGFFKNFPSIPQPTGSCRAVECGEFVKLFLVKSAGDGLGVGLAQLQGGCVSKTGKFCSKK